MMSTSENFDPKSIIGDLQDRTQINKIIETLDSIAVIKDSRSVGKNEGRTRKTLVRLNSPWEARLLVHNAVQPNLYVTNNVLVMPALSKEDLDFERKVMRKRYNIITQGIPKTV